MAGLALLLLSTVTISLSGVMMPGPVFAVTVTHGRRSPRAGSLVALGHGLIEFPLMALVYLDEGTSLCTAAIGMLPSPRSA